MNLCRCCLQGIDNGVVKLSETMTASNGNICMSNDHVLTISECLNICTDIPINNNSKMTQKMCQECYNELKVSFEFRAKCENSYLILCDRLKSNTIEIHCENEPVSADGIIDENIQEYRIEINNEQALNTDDADSSMIIEVMENKINVADDEFGEGFSSESIDNNLQQQANIKIITLKNEQTIEITDENQSAGGDKNIGVCENEYIILHNTTMKKNSHRKQKTDRICEDITKNWYECETCTVGFS